MAATILLCFAGLLRVSEALALKGNDVHFADGKLIVVLNETKRGVHQKVLYSDSRLVRWFSLYDQLVREKSGDAKYCPISYGVFQRWFRKSARALGSSMEWSSHSLRRGGATEMQRRHVPLTDIMVAGRWASARSAKEYLRKGDIALLRHEASLDVECTTRLQRFACIGEEAWGLAGSLTG